jgi:hypothetical protein
MLSHAHTSSRHGQVRSERARVTGQQASGRSSFQFLIALNRASINQSETTMITSAMTPRPARETTLPVAAPASSLVLSCAGASAAAGPSASGESAPGASASGESAAGPSASGESAAGPGAEAGPSGLESSDGVGAGARPGFLLFDGVGAGAGALEWALSGA